MDYTSNVFEVQKPSHKKNYKNLTFLGFGSKNVKNY